MQRRMTLINQDVVFASTSDLIKLKKHVQVGIALQSMTESSKVLGIMNKHGRCVKFCTTEEIKT